MMLNTILIRTWRVCMVLAVISFAAGLIGTAFFHASSDFFYKTTSVAIAAFIVGLVMLLMVET